MFEHNQITQTGANAILLEQHWGPTDVSHNTFDRGVGDGASDAYFNMNYGGKHITTLQKVSYNKIDMGANCSGCDFDYDHRGTGITFAAGFTGTKGGFTNVVISHNQISNLRANRRGIGTWNNATDPDEGDILATINYNRIIGEVGEDITGSKGIDTIGFISNTLISYNNVQNVDIGIQLREWNSDNAYGCHISHNRIDANLGVELQQYAEVSEITKNTILSDPPAAVSLLPDTLQNSITNNYLRAGLLITGDSAVLDLGTWNVVSGNR